MVELRELLQQRGMGTAGKKEELIKRLVATAPVAVGETPLMAAKNAAPVVPTRHVSPEAEQEAAKAPAAKKRRQSTRPAARADGDQENSAVNVGTKHDAKAGAKAKDLPEVCVCSLMSVLPPTP